MQFVPKRIILRFDERYVQEESIIISNFYNTFEMTPDKDLHVHLLAANNSSKMYIILDLHCKTFPSVDLHDIVYEVFKVKKSDKL